MICGKVLGEYVIIAICAMYNLVWRPSMMRHTDLLSYSCKLIVMIFFL